MELEGCSAARERASLCRGGGTRPDNPTIHTLLLWRKGGKNNVRLFICFAQCSLLEGLAYILAEILVRSTRLLALEVK